MEPVWGPGSNPDEVCRSVWYSCKSYRANIFMRGDKLFIRDLTKFDDRYAERYMDRPCEAWDALYDNLPVVDSRIWSKDGKECALTFDTRAKGFTAVEHGQALEITVRFKGGVHGLIYLSPNGITFEGCGVMSYNTGVPHDTAIDYADNTFSFTHNGYDYAIPTEGCRVEATENGYRLVPTAAVKVDMSQR